MNRWKLLLMLTCHCWAVNAQSTDDSRIADARLRIPDAQTHSTETIASYVNQNFKTDGQKAKAIYSWVSLNIRYDTDSANIINLGTDPALKITAALRRRRGVCENFAAIFNDICVKSGLVSFIVDGYTLQNGIVDKAGHSWCAVYIDGNWSLCDPTWDVGVKEARFFLVKPEDMIASHMPFDPMWQLLDHPVSHREFSEGITTARKNNPFFNYSDSISAYRLMGSLQRFRFTAARIQQSGLYNNLVKNRFEFNRMHIEIIREDKDVDLYNASVAELNEITRAYNDFVEYRNKQFMPAIRDAAMVALLDGTDRFFLSAYKKLDDIAGSAATFTFSTEALRKKLDWMSTRIDEQKTFLNLYLRTPRFNRVSLFYSKQIAAGK